MATTGTTAGDGGPLLLAGDVGGTKTDLAVVSAAGGPRETLARRRYVSAAYPGLAEMAKECLDDAGPVMDGQAQLTNLDWRLDERSLTAQLSLEQAWLINDLVAIASAIP